MKTTNKNTVWPLIVSIALLFASGVAQADIPAGYTALETITYSYDEAGNRIAKGATVSGTPETPIEAQYDTGNRLTELTLKGQGPNGTDLTCTLGYDLNGNLSSKTCGPDATQYIWDARNRLTGIQSPSVTASFKYDALGRRIERTVNGDTLQYLYDGDQAIAELRNGTVSTHILTGLAIDEAIARYTTEGERILLTDALGSVLLTTKEDTAATTAYGYSPYGETQLMGTDEHNPIQYTARENDDTGLYYYRARYYDPQLKRFISEDPIGIAGGLNIYSYVGGSPVAASDPLGLTMWTGKYETKSMIEGLGASTTTYTLTSECVDGKKATVTVIFVGPGLGAGVPKLPPIATQTYGDITFNDFNYSNKIQPERLEGLAGDVGVSVQIGSLGVSANRARLGHAASTGTGGNQTGGVDIGAQLVMGSSTITSIKWEKCCE